MAFIVGEMRSLRRVKTRKVMLATVLRIVYMVRKEAGKLPRMLLHCPKVTVSK